MRKNNNKFRSFSDAGSTTSTVLSAVGPVMANLLSNKNSNAPFTPEYMRRPQVSVEDTPQHQDFKAAFVSCALIWKEGARWIQGLVSHFSEILV
jgi:hypothetical protein